MIDESHGGPHVAFNVRMELRQLLGKSGGDQYVGQAKKTFRAPTIPVAGDYLVGICPYGERPVIDQLRVIRVLIEPTPQWSEDESRPSVTTVVRGFLQASDQLPVVHAMLAKNGWATELKVN